MATPPGQSRCCPNCSILLKRFYDRVCLSHALALPLEIGAGCDHRLRLSCLSFGPMWFKLFLTKSEYPSLPHIGQHTPPQTRASEWIQ